MTQNRSIKKRGRPKKINFLDNRPDYLPLMTEDKKNWWDSFLNNLTDAENVILSGYSSWVPKSLIYDLASIGDESLYGHEQKILGKYNRRKKLNFRGRSAGRDATKNKADIAARELWGRYKALYRQVARKKISLNSASSAIHRQLKGKGIPLKDVPTIRTISNWYRRIKEL